MKFNLTLAFFWLMAILYLTSHGSPTIYYVDAQNGNDGNPGTSWTSPKATIGAALQLAADGDTICVAEGRYLERLTLPPGVTLLGGFPAGGGTRDPQIHETIIDAQQQGSVLVTLLDSHDVVDGFTITGGSAVQGGGVFALGTSVFRHLKVVNNHATSLGGGFFCGQGVSIESCQILNNDAPRAPGMAIIGSSAVRNTISVRHSQVLQNITSPQGFSSGAVFINLHVNVDFSHNLVADNAAPDGGVFIEESYGQKTLDHNTITGNGKRGLSVTNGFTVLVTNSIIYGHTLADVDMQGDTVSKPTLRYSDIGTINGLHQEQQLISLNPQFVDPANGDYTLKATSPCIDAGDPSSPPDADGTVTDMGAFPYLNDSTVPVELTFFTAHLEDGGVTLRWQTQSETNNFGFDIERKTTSDWVKVGFVKGHGTTTVPHSYQYQEPLPQADEPIRTLFYRLKQIDTDGSFRYSRVVSITIEIPGSPELSQNYPNPFNPTTTIVYTLNRASHVELKVYDVMGHEVAVLVDEFKTPGKYDVEFDATGLPSGVYAYKLTAGSFTQMKKLVVVK